MVRRQVCIQRTRNGGLGMPDLESHWLAERLSYLGRSLTTDAVWRHKASRTFPLLKLVPKADGRVDVSRWRSTVCPRVLGGPS